MEKMIYALLSANTDQKEVISLLAGRKGLSGADLYLVSTAEMAVVACDIKRDDIIANSYNAIEYASVIEMLAQHFTLLPVRFGSVMESTDAILQMLERNLDDIQQNLLKVEKKYEFGLKIFCDSEKLKADLKAKPEAMSKRAETADQEITQSIYRDWVNKKLKEHRLEEMLLTYVDSVIAEIKGHLCMLQAVSKFNKMKTSTMIIDAVFLLDMERKDALIGAVADLQNQHSSLTFVLTGPWPPYNFVDFTVK
jgi:hypothetical protein